MNGINPLIEQLQGKVKAAQEQLEAKEPALAEALAKEVLEACGRAGIRSGHLHWVLAVAHDHQGELEPAFEQIEQAVVLDPLEPAYRKSFDIIRRRVGEALGDADREESDPSTARLYRLLLRHGVAPVTAHLAMVRHLTATGALAEARKLASAVTLLHPTEAPAWRALAIVARLAGDEATAADADAQAVAAAPDERPFGVPGMAEA